MKTTRRRFLKVAAAISAAVSLSGSRSPADEPAAKHPVRLGGPVYFSEDDPEKWVREARKYYRAVYCPKVALDEPDRIKAFAAAIRENDMVIAEIGRWCNLLAKNPEERKKNLDNVIDGLALAEEIGGRCCVNIAGSFNPDRWEGPHPKNLGKDFFEAIVENARKIIDAVKPKRAKFAYEMMPWALPDTVESYLALIKAIDREGFGVHLDICNMINSPAKMYDNRPLIEDVFERLGPHIVSCHAKDLKWGPGGQVNLLECPIGDGVVDYRAYLKGIANHPDKDLPLMLEHMKDREEYELCRKRIFEIGRDSNVVFEYL